MCQPNWKSRAGSTILPLVALFSVTCSAAGQTLKNSDLAADSILRLGAKADSLRLSGISENLQGAVELYAQVAAFHRLRNDSTGSAKAFNDQGLTYAQLGLPDFAKRSYEAARVLFCGQGPSVNCAISTSNLAGIYINQRNADSALFHLDAAREVARISGSIAQQAVAARLTGDAHGLARHDDSAFSHYARAVGLYELVSDSGGAGSTLINVGNLRYARGEYDQAREALLRAVTLLVGEGSESQLNFARYNLANVHMALGEFDLARELLSRVATATELANLRALALINWGAAERQAGNLETATEISLRAVTYLRSFPPDSLTAIAMGNLGELYHNRAKLDSALAWYRAAADLDGRLSTDRHRGKMLGKIAELFRETEESDSVRAYALAAVEMERTAGAPAQQALATIYLAEVWQSLGRPDSALARARDALMLAQPTGDKHASSSAYGALAEVFRSIGVRDSAVFYQTLAFGAASEGRNPQQLSLSEINFGVVLWDIGRREEALSHLRAGLARARRIPDAMGEQLASGVLAVLFESSQQPDSARFYNRVALSLAMRRNDLSAQAVLHNGLGNLYLAERQYPLALAEFLSGRRLVPAGKLLDLTQTLLYNLGWMYKQVPELRDLARSTAYFDTAAALASRIRRSAGNDFRAVRVGEEQSGIYSEWSRAWIGRAQEVGAEVSKASALGALERGRAQALLELLQRPAKEGTVGAGEALSQPGRNLAAEADSFLAPLRRTHTAALTHLVGGGRLLTWFLTPTGELRILPYHDTGWQDVWHLVTALQIALRLSTPLDSIAPPGIDRQAITRLASLGADSLLSMLGRALLPASIADELPAGAELVIVPSEMTWLVPYAALRTSSGESLGLRYGLRYAPSFATLRAIERNRMEGRPPVDLPLERSVVVGNPSMPPDPARADGKRLDSLPSALLEADSVAAWLRGAPTLSAGSATETFVRRMMPEAPVIHLATHGRAFTGESSVRSSYVALARGGGSPSDGLLTVGELLDDPALNLSAELVVLSACQTALGNLNESEGTVGFARALLARGARSVVVSQWNVDGQATRMLMTRFYRYWLHDGLSKAEALRRAQGDVRNTPGFRSPRFWAAFQLFGAN